MKIDPIPTKYKNIEFRSRTEARWAIAFDEANIRWEYEPEAFHLKNPYSDNIEFFNYLPDFRISYPESRLSYWAEVKGKTFTENELVKAWALTKETEEPIILLPRTPSYASYIFLDGKFEQTNYLYSLSNNELISWSDCLLFEKESHLYQTTGEIPDYLERRISLKNNIFEYSYNFGDEFNHPEQSANSKTSEENCRDPVGIALNYPFYKPPKKPARPRRPKSRNKRRQHLLQQIRKQLAAEAKTNHKI